jgi:hypothetical protein
VRRLLAAALAGLALLPARVDPGAADEPAQTLSLTVPRALAAGEIVWIEVRAGPLRRGQEISVTTAAGQPLGTISPFGIRSGQDAGAYSLPVPADAIKDGRLTIRLSISEIGGARAPTTQEIRGVTLKIAPR